MENWQAITNKIKSNKTKFCNGQIDVLSYKSLDDIKEEWKQLSIIVLLLMFYVFSYE